MPNRSSHARHKPLRTCVICRRKSGKVDLLRFVLMRKEAVFDLTGKFPGRGYYVCDDNFCIERLSKWIIKRLKKKDKISPKG